MFAQTTHYVLYYFQAGKNYVITAVSGSIGVMSKVIATGAQFTCTTDATAFNLNSDDTAQLNNFTWTGGLFKNTAGTKLASIGLYIEEFRGIKVQEARFEGFFKANLVVDRDTFTFENNHYFNNTHSVYVDETLSDGTWGALIINIIDCHFSINGKESGVYVDGIFSNLHIKRNSFNGDSSNSIFITSENSSASIRGISIEQNHFEQGVATTKYIYLTDGIGTNQFLSPIIKGNTFNNAEPDAIVAERVTGFDISGNTFSQTSGNGTPIDLDVNCLDINIDKSNFFSTAPIVFACARSEITFGDAFVTADHKAITDYFGNSFSTSNATIDMSAKVSAAFPTTAGMVPKGWLINVQARDSGSETSTTARIDLDNDNTGTSQQRAMLKLAGIIDDAGDGVIVAGQYYVPADSNGDIWVNIFASGTSTMDVWLTVMGYYM